MTQEEQERLDPSHNVTGVVTAAVGRLDDLAVLAHQRTDDLRQAEARRVDNLSEAERRYNDLRAAHGKEMADLDRAHRREVDAKESSRLDSIRQVDREEVTKTAAAANLAIATLAKQTTDLATTLQNTVQTTAGTAETRRATDMGEVNKRVSALELSSSEGKGKSAISDPALIELTAELRTLTKLQSTSSGKSEGISGTMAMAIAVGTLIVGLLGFFAVSNNRSSGNPILPAGYQLVPIQQPAPTTKP